MRQKGGYANFYNGYGLKAVQEAWQDHQNPDLQPEGEEAEECHEPNPKELPPPEAPPEAEEPQDE